MKCGLVKRLEVTVAATRSSRRCLKAMLVWIQMRTGDEDFSDVTLAYEEAD